MTTVKSKQVDSPKTFREILKTPSAALTAMCDGLLRQSRRKKFRVMMSTFGVSNNNGVCFGCAATCTVQQVHHHNFTSSEILGFSNRAQALGVILDDLGMFEEAIDCARSGMLENLAEYFQLPTDCLDKWKDRWGMTTNNWKEQIPAVRKAIREMKAEGF